MPRFIIFALLFALAPFAARAQAPIVELQAPRDFGYLIGDVIALEAAIAAPPGFKLQTASLPKPRQLSVSLDLRRMEVSETAGPSSMDYRLRLEYQTFYSALETKRLEIPAITVRLESAGGDIRDAVIPPWSFTMSPLRELAPAEAARRALLQPDRNAALIPAAGSLAAAIAALFGALLALAALAHHYALWPFQARPSRPFTQAGRTLKALAGEGDEGRYRDGLLALHRAFDETAGRRVFANDAAAFVTEHPVFSAAKGDIVEFFQVSRRAFFNGEISAAADAWPMGRIRELARRLASLEREQA